MALYLLRRLAALVAVLFVMSFIVFCLQRIMPSDPARAMAGPTAPAAAVEPVRARLGLDDPILTQYGRFLAGAGGGRPRHLDPHPQAGDRRSPPLRRPLRSS